MKKRLFSVVGCIILVDNKLVLVIGFIVLIISCVFRLVLSTVITCGLIDLFSETV